MIITEDLLKRLLDVFPENAQKIKEYVKEGNNDKLLKLLFNETVHPSFNRDIEAFKEGRLDDISFYCEERKKRGALVLELVGL